MQHCRAFTIPIATQLRPLSDNEPLHAHLTAWISYRPRERGTVGILCLKALKHCISTTLMQELERYGMIVYE